MKLYDIACHRIFWITYCFGLETQKNNRGTGILESVIMVMMNCGIIIIGDIFIRLLTIQ
jgi:hypothetical protein